jgi:hypothetical protein
MANVGLVYKASRRQCRFFFFSQHTFKGRAGDHHVELAAASVALVRRANVHRARQRRQQLGLEPRGRHGVRHCRWRGGVAVAGATVAVVMRRIRARGFFLVAVPVPVVVSRVVVSLVVVAACWSGCSRWRGGVAVAGATVAVVMRSIRARGFFLVAVPVPVVVSRVVVSRVAVVDAAARIAAACRCRRRGRRGSYLHGRRRRVGHHDARGLEACSDVYTCLDVYTSKRLPAAKYECYIYIRIRT